MDITHDAPRRHLYLTNAVNYRFYRERLGGTLSFPDFIRMYGANDDGWSPIDLYRNAE